MISKIVGDSSTVDRIEFHYENTSNYDLKAYNDFSALVGVKMNAISEGALTLSGVEFGYSLQDYRNVTSTQGSAIKLLSLNLRPEAMHAACRPDEVYR